MSVYVDEPIEYEHEVAGYIGRARSRYRWCHMIADTTEELHAMAMQIGLRRAWFQGDPTGRGHDHYDLVPSKRTLAIKHGAKAITLHELGVMLNDRTAAWRAARPEPEG